MAGKKTIWELPPHSLGKHLVLQAYLEAWFPKLGFGHERLLFVDGFAGPGEYDKGERGSPIIALDTLLEHEHREAINTRAVFVFIEKDPDRYRHLSSLVDARRPSLPTGWDVHVAEGVFDETLTAILDIVDEQERQLAPAFVMIDPFGVSDTPHAMVRRILRNDKAEVYISFMYEAINRFKTTPEFPKHLDELFGCEDWRDGLALESPAARQDFFFGLYDRQLRAAGATHVVHFDLYEGNRLVYGVFFGTKHWKGADVMKKAVWKVAPFGDFCFRGTRSAQLQLGLSNADFRPLREALTRQFRGLGWLEVGFIEQFVASDSTDYHTGHVRKQALESMEDARQIEVDPASRKRRRTYPKGCRIRFL